MFPERDMMIAEKLISVQKEWKNPQAYTIAWAKNQKQEVVDIVKKLIYEGGSKMGLNLSVQSMDDDVLAIIKRKNLEMNKIEQVFELCEEHNIPLYTELILGLPGESMKSWKNNFYALYRSGNHTGITVYQAQLLENAEMNLTQKKMYKMEGRIVYDYLVGTYNEHEVKEGIEVITATRDLPRDQMVEAQLFSWFMNTFHINGMTNYISRVLEKKHDIQYEDFYDNLLEFIKEDPWLNDEMNRIKEHYFNWTENGKIDHEPIQGMEIHGWNLIHSTVINLQGQGKHKQVFDMVESFVKERYGDLLSPELFQDLMLFQRKFLINFEDKADYPMNIQFEHDISGYLQDHCDLETHAEYEFDFPEDKEQSLERFCEQIFFARRRNFGKAWLTKL